MSPAFERVKTEIDQLPRREQYYLYEALRERFEPSEDEPEGGDEVEAEWDREIARRVAEIEAGEAELVSWEDVKKDLERLRAERRDPIAGLKEASTHKVHEMPEK